MKEYTSWKLRREIISLMNETHIEGDWSEKDAFSYSMMINMLIVVDHIDWTTGRKTFTGEKHFNNWLKSLARVNGLKGRNDWKLIRSTIEYMGDLGMASFDGETKTLSLHNRTEG